MTLEITNISISHLRLMLINMLPSMRSAEGNNQIIALPFDLDGEQLSLTESFRLWYLIKPLNFSLLPIEIENGGDSKCCATPTSMGGFNPSIETHIHPTFIISERSAFLKTLRALCVA